MKKRLPSLVVFIIYILLSSIALYFYQYSNNKFGFIFVLSLFFILYHLISSKIKGATFHPFNMFLYFYFFYNFTSLFFYFIFDFKTMGWLYNKNDMIIVYEQALISYFILISLSIVFFKGDGIDVETVSLYINSLKPNISKIYLFYLSLILSLFTFYVFYSSGLMSISNFNRSDINSNMNTNLWYFIGVLSFITLIVAIIKYDASFKCKITIFLCLIYFLLDLLIGGRKFLFYTCFTAFAYLKLTNKLKIKYVIFIVIFLGLAMFARGVVDKVDVNDRDMLGILSGYLGEFLFTNVTSFITLNNYSVLCSDYNILGYFNWISYLIPRSIFEGKPYSLAYEFAHFMDVGIGFAFTPLSESICVNPSFAGVIVSGFIFLFFYIISRLWRHRPFLYFIVYALLLDFNRAESMYYFTQIITVYLCYVIILYIVSTSKRIVKL
ncbi:O-antigen polysaccharide polymerase Wzy [Aliivibrio fischeri]|uniref:O-antigen polysaccharide polymerase Wzy n=1 Tax=Aliivibrio fischeri TaxID=668 RepID=UPI001F2296AB|nr:O-antigen polysaccharide polymerase Wzy [Aliivibrio fischeri]MCE7556847.1 oligosaccharide repeat unit polymerase [Aliivibrio fischeri]MCE7563305.1 oligosaccharide repeat unit polymerase [Aliivibrio fischeri]MCE7570274.1 oligosaccharide repeat unit polymerase [Aliivibrio fischeri]